MTNSITSIVAPLTLTVGPPALLIVLNPYMALAILAFAMPLFIFMVIHIIRKCSERDKRLDALATRAIRRAHARHLDSQ
jgi:putative exporter of polyketide antibiotics